VPAVPKESTEDMIVNDEDPTVIEPAVANVCAGLPESVTPIIKLDVPLVVGVPDITPFCSDRASPAGRLPDVIPHL
jgi:hypothetical protein